jgi:hypothetical protein
VLSPYTAVLAQLYEYSGSSGERRRAARRTAVPVVAWLARSRPVAAVLSPYTAVQLLSIVAAVAS